MTFVDPRPRIGVFGAGLVGCYVGGCLALGGADVTFVGRGAAMDRLAGSGLRLTDAAGGDRRVSPETFTATTRPDALLGADLILLTVKSDQTREAARAIAHGVFECPVLSLQNGVGNMPVLREVLGDARALQGIVPYNVARVVDGHLHRGTSGQLIAQDDPRLRSLRGFFDAGRAPIGFHDDMTAVAWTKLLMNLNNAVNALSGLRLGEQLRDWRYRRVVALIQLETLAVLRSAGIRPAKLGRRRPGLAPHLLSLPNYALTMLGYGGLLRVDPDASSSMADDLAAGRRTEVAHINGAVVELARRIGVAAPRNRLMVDLVRRAEGGARAWAAADLLALVRSPSDSI